MAYQLALLAAFVAIGGLIELPFDWFETFRIEQRFGFNRMSLALWIADLAKGLLLATAIGLPLAALVLFATPWGWGAPRQVLGADRSTLWRVVLLGIITAGSSVLFVTSVKWADVAVAAVLSSTAPLFALPLGLIFLGERVTRSALAGTALAVTGVALIQL